MTGEQRCTARKIASDHASCMRATCTQQIAFHMYRRSGTNKIRIHLSQPRGSFKSVFL